MAHAETIPARVRKMKVGERIRWARMRAGLSHDRLIERIGRSNRSHLIKIEKGDHVPRGDLRDAIADATGVSRDLFHDEDDEEADPAMRETYRMFRDLVGRINARTETKV